jgi:hypothetical protein
MFGKNSALVHSGCAWLGSEQVGKECCAGFAACWNASSTTGHLITFELLTCVSVAGSTMLLARFTDP